MEFTVQKKAAGIILISRLQFSKDFRNFLFWFFCMLHFCKIFRYPYSLSDLSFAELGGGSMMQQLNGNASGLSAVITK